MAFRGLSADNKIKQIIDRLDKAKSIRANYDTLWDDIAEVMFPGRIGFSRQLEPGSRRTNHLVNSAGARASRKLGAVLQGSVSPRQTRWVDVQAEDRGINEQGDVQGWFEIVNEVIYNHIYDPRTGWERSSAAIYRDIGTFGSSVVFNAVKPDGSLFFSAIPLRDTWVETNAYDEISTFFVERDVTVQQAVQMFKGPERLSTKLQRQWSDMKLTDRVKLLHFVTERLEREPGKRDKLNKPWLSIWMEVDEKHIIEEGGFDYQPYIYPRLETVVGEVYPWSPGRLALPDVLMLQAQERSLLKSAHFQSEPPLLVPDNGFIDADQYAPGEFLHYDAALLEQMGSSQFPVQPLFTGHNASITEPMVAATRDEIWQAFMLDLVQLPDQPNMTATEILRRNEDFSRMAGPSFAQLADEYPAAIVETVFQRLLEQSVQLGFEEGSPFPLPPEAIQGKKTKANVKAPIQGLQKQVELSSALSSMTEALMPIIELDPSARHHLNTVEVARESIRVFGRASFLRDENEATELIEGEQQAAAREQQVAEGGAEAQMLQQLSQADKNVAGAQPAEGESVPA